MGDKPVRIMVFGRPGSGKSTFAYQLHRQTRLPLYHLDKYFFTDHWVERDYQEFLSLQQQLVDQEKWIIDGNSTKSFEIRYRRAQLCLYFNFPKYLCYWRVCKRIFYKDKAINDRANNCPERISWPLLKYMWGFETRVFPALKRLQHQYPDVHFIEVKSDQALVALSHLWQNNISTRL